MLSTKSEYNNLPIKPQISESEILELFPNAFFSINELPQDKSELSVFIADQSM